MTDDQLRMLQDLSDRQQIFDVLLRYTRGIDRCNADMINSTYHDDAEAVYQNFTAVGNEIGPALINLVENIQPRKSAQHVISNHLCRIDGDVAHSETYFVSFGVSKSDSPEILMENGGRYLDKFERRNGEWKIAERTIVFDWRRNTELPPKGQAASGLYGQRDHTDESYKFLPDL